VGASETVTATGPGKRLQEESRGGGQGGGRTAGGELEREHTAFVEVQLVLFRLAHVQDLHVAALHAYSQPVLVGAVAQGENLGKEGRARIPDLFQCWGREEGC
jgi:hypothetical protein